ncbi:MAG: hypothetical protein HDS65_04705 [Bacteroidales bacterium]|nr:hypothetical protein [Bacteroidales bacterium]
MNTISKKLITGILLCFVVALVFPAVGSADLQRPGRYELSRRLKKKVLKSYYKGWARDSVYVYRWNPNSSLNSCLFLRKEFRGIAKYVDIKTILPVENPEIYVAKYDTIIGDSFGEFIGFHSVKLDTIARESYAYTCINESYSDESLKICEDRDTIISIRSFIEVKNDLKYDENVSFFSRSDSVFIAENIANADRTKIMQEFTTIVRNWDIDEISSLLKKDGPLNGDSSFLFFSRAIFQNKQMKEYSCYFCYYPFFLSVANVTLDRYWYWLE